MFGPQFGKRRGILRPAGQALYKYSDVYSKAYSDLSFTQVGSAPSSNAFAMDFGFGLDIAVSPRFSIRPFEASYLYTKFNNDLSANENSTRFLAGVVFKMGVKPPLQLTVACSANQTSVFPGEPVTVTATVGSQDPKLGVVYSISGDGITGASNSATATANTADLTPGQHTVRCDAKEGKPGKEGAKPWQVATQSTAASTAANLRAADDLLLGEPDDHQAGRQRHHHGHRGQPAEPPGRTYTYSASARQRDGHRRLGEPIRRRA